LRKFAVLSRILHLSLLFLVIEFFDELSYGAQSAARLVGLAAASLGLPAAMWLLLIGPLALIIFLPSNKSQEPQVV
jgi:hypothetical protein